MQVRSSRFTRRLPRVTNDCPDLLGAHVSTAGGIGTAPARGAEIGATAIQVFTKTPNRWHEPKLDPTQIEQFKAELERSSIAAVVTHDSYLINLASPDTANRERSITSFKLELQRCRDLGIDFVVTHPGNFLDDRAAGLHRNTAAYAECLAAVDGPTILIETTAGTGTALGSTFAELAALRDGLPEPLQKRVGFCADTCHLFSAGYDLVQLWDEVWQEWEDVIGMDLLRCVHLNDSKTPFDSRRDRHELIAEGTLGAEPFRRIMQDERFQGIIKIIETPKGEDPAENDRLMLERLRSYARRAA